MPIYVNVDSPTNNCPGSEKQHGLINKTILIALDKSHVFVETNYRYISLHSITSFLFISSFLSGVFISKHFSFLLLCCPLVPPNSPPVPAQGAGHQGGEHTRCWPDSLLLLFCFEYFAAGHKGEDELDIHCQLTLASSYVLEYTQSWQDSPPMVPQMLEMKGTEKVDFVEMLFLETEELDEAEVSVA